MSINNLFFKYFVYYPVLILRGEWIGKHLKQLNKTQYVPKEQLEDIQLKRLNELLKHARETVPYYKNLPSKALSNLSELSSIPFLEKDDLRNFNSELRSLKKGSMVRYKTTGGSTGAAVTVRKEPRGMARELAATWRGCSWAGVDIGDKQARFWGVPHGKWARRKARLIDFIANRRRVSAFSFSDEDLEIYCRRLKQFNPDYFYGYVSMIKEFAEYVSKHSEYQGIRPKAIFTTAEVLNPVDREKIEEIFGCKVYNEYGCGEIGTIAHECEYGAMHISAENIVVEVLGEEGNSVEPGKGGELVITDLVNFSMPLIRYRIKDFGGVCIEGCSCGRTLPVMDGIYGREYDMLVNSDGEKFHGEFFLYMIEDITKNNFIIDGFQIVQESECLYINIKCDQSSFAPVKEYLSDSLVNHFDAKMPINIRKVDSIPRESSGKLRVVKRISKD